MYQIFLIRLGNFVVHGRKTPKGKGNKIYEIKNMEFYLSKFENNIQYVSFSNITFISNETRE